MHHRQKLSQRLTETQPQAKLADSLSVACAYCTLSDILLLICPSVHCCGADQLITFVVPVVFTRGWSNVFEIFFIFLLWTSRSPKWYWHWDINHLYSGQNLLQTLIHFNVLNLHSVKTEWKSVHTVWVMTSVIFYLSVLTYVNTSQFS
jgi:hypothetical protein